MWGAPARVWHILLGSGFPLSQGGSYRRSAGPVCGHHRDLLSRRRFDELRDSRKIGNVSWVQLGFSGAIVGGIYLLSQDMHDVIMVQTMSDGGAAGWVSVPFLRVETSNRPQQLLARAVGAA